MINDIAISRHKIYWLSNGMSDTIYEINRIYLNLFSFCFNQQRKKKIKQNLTNLYNFSGHH